MYTSIFDAALAKKPYRMNLHSSELRTK